MQNEISQHSRRRSPRFNIFLDAQIIYSEHEKEKKINSNIIDISKHGIKLISKEKLTVNQDIRIDYTSLISKEQFSLTGRVKWQTYKNMNYYIGFELNNKQNNNIQHMESINNYYQESACTMQDPCLNKRHNHYFHYEFFCGLLFETLSKFIEEKIIHISTDINISKAYFENALNKIKKNSLSAKDIDNIGSSLTKISHIQDDFVKFVSLLQILKDEKHSKNLARTENSYCLLNLNVLFEERAQAFLKKLECLSLSDKIALTWRSSSTIPRHGSSWLIAYGIDFLLLYSYLSSITESASFLHANLLEAGQTTYINIVNNGNKLFLHDKQEVIIKYNNAAIYDLSYMEKRHISILNYALYYFREFKSDILIKSSPGHNLLSMRLYN